MAAPDRRIPPRAVAAVAALVVALEATDAAAAARARLRHSAQLWWQGVERRQRGTVRRRALARALRVPPRG